MIEIILGIGVFFFAVFTVFQVLYLIELRRTGRAVRTLIEHVDEKLSPSLQELELTLRNTRIASENAATITKHLQDLTDVAALLAGLWAAIRTGITALYRNVQEKKGGESGEGGEETGKTA
jgi:hypothetical protein